MEIRQLEVRDFEAVGQLWKDVDLVASGYDTDTELRSALRRHADLCFVAVNGETVIGSVLGFELGWGGLIGRLAVSETQRGQGIGKQLVATVERRMQELGLRGAAIMTWKEKPEAQRFWDNAGYISYDNLLPSWNGWAEETDANKAMPSKVDVRNG